MRSVHVFLILPHPKRRSMGSVHVFLILPHPDAILRFLYSPAPRLIACVSPRTSALRLRSGFETSSVESRSCQHFPFGYCHKQDWPRLDTTALKAVPNRYGTGPSVMGIPTIEEGHQEARVRDAFHFSAKPLRCESVGTPSIEPAKAINALGSG